jgi:hypothetical protein
LNAAPMVVVVQHAHEEFFEDARSFPLLKPTMTRLPGPELVWDRPPLAAGAQAVDDAAHHGAIVVAWSATSRASRWGLWNQQLQFLPQRFRNRTVPFIHGGADSILNATASLQINF